MIHLLLIAFFLVFFLYLKSKSIESKQISVSLLKENYKNKLILNLTKQNECIIGYHKNTPVYISNDKRKMHTLITGSTGVGKTTLLLSYLLHSAKHNFPSIVIDPKGEMSTLEKFKFLCKENGVLPKLKVFSFSDQSTSLSFNPLSIGSPIEIKDRIISSLEFSEPYYKACSTRILSSICNTLDLIKHPITINKIKNILIYPEEKIWLKKIALESKLDLDLLKELDQNLKQDQKNITGLISQLETIDNYEFSKLINHSNQNGSIDLLESISNKEIIYFQVGSMQYSDLTKIFGKLIIENLKSLCSIIQTKRYPHNFTPPDFIPIYIDEFGTFASNPFIELLKQSRSANFALHLFHQGLGDLDHVGQSFKTQVIDNTINKITFRLDDPTHAEYFSKMAGTIESKAKSYQINQTMIGNEKTGLGNLRDVKEMAVEHDVYKKLNIGQAIYLTKNPHEYKLIKTFNL